MEKVKNKSLKKLIFGAVSTAALGASLLYGVSVSAITNEEISKAAKQTAYELRTSQLNASNLRQIFMNFLKQLNDSDVQCVNQELYSKLKQLISEVANAEDTILENISLEVVNNFELAKNFVDLLDKADDLTSLNQAIESIRCIIAIERRASAGGFVNAVEYLHSMAGGFVNAVEYLHSMAGGFVNAVEYLHSMAGGFDNAAEYRFAMTGGFDNAAEYRFAMTGGFDNAAEYRAARTGGFDNAAEYCFARTGGFNNAEEYRAAKAAGFKNVIEYYEARTGGFDNAEEYRFARTGGFDNAAEYRKARAGGFRNAARYRATMDSIFKDAEKYREYLRKSNQPQ